VNAKIRRLTRSDLPQVVRLMAELGYPTDDASLAERVAAVSANPDDAVLVAEKAGVIVGLVAMHSFEMLHRPGRLGRITAFVVSQSARRRGIGRQLLGDAESHLRLKGCIKLEVTSGETRSDAHGFYAALGYREPRVHFVKEAYPMTDSPTRDREFVHSRVIDATPERLFEALSTASRLARWWGPAGFSSTFQTFEFRPGGEWKFVMHGPDGTNYPNESVFTEIVPARRVVIEHISDVHHFLLTITLEPVDGGTRVGWQQVFDTAEHRDQIAHVVIDANEQNLDRLAAEARSQSE
jgi:uncharacterized protein YndB with AHSA1/START domain/GNAT superfamily N-acetyltransferase